MILALVQTPDYGCATLVSTADDKARARIAAVKRRIVGMDLVASGTLLERTKVCGKPTCSCASDEKARHGPYYEWNRRLQGHLHHRSVDEKEARVILHAMDDYQRLLGLLEDWEHESVRVILGTDRPTPRNRKVQFAEKPPAMCGM